MGLAHLLSFLIAAAPRADQAPRPKLAVLGVHAENGVSQGTANLLSELISTDVMHTGHYDVLTSADVATMIGIERQRALLGCNQNDNCFVEISQALGSDLILDASVGTVGNLRVLAMRLYDAQKGRAVARESITVNDESGLVEAVHLAVTRVLGLHPPEPVTAPAPAAEVSAPSGRSRLGWGLLAGAGGLAVFGAVFGVLALGEFNAFRASPFDDGLGNSARSKAYVADGLYAGALVVAAAAVVLLLVLR